MLEDAGKRNTRQKKAIQDCLERMRGSHFTADELQRTLETLGENVGRATIYRTLAAMTREGTVKRFCLHDDASTCYQYIGQNSACQEHYHMRCDSCGKLLHFESDSLGAVLRALERSNAFFIDERKTVFYGNCADCNTEKLGTIKEKAEKDENEETILIR